MWDRLEREIVEHERREENGKGNVGEQQGFTAV